MKIALTTQGSTLEALLDPRFGRCRFFILFDSETQLISVIENTQQLNATQGAGIQAAQHVIRAGAQALISGHCGPKAFRVLKAAGIPIYLSDAKPLTEVLQLFDQKALNELTSPDVEGHWV